MIQLASRSAELCDPDRRATSVPCRAFRLTQSSRDRTRRRPQELKITHSARRDDRIIPRRKMPDKQIGRQKFEFSAISTMRCSSFDLFRRSAPADSGRPTTAKTPTCELTAGACLSNLTVFYRPLFPIASPKLPPFATCGVANARSTAARQAMSAVRRITPNSSSSGTRRYFPPWPAGCGAARPPRPGSCRSARGGADRPFPIPAGPAAALPCASRWRRC